MSVFESPECLSYILFSTVLAGEKKENICTSAANILHASV